MNIEQEARIANLQEQLASVQHGLGRLPQEVGAVVGDRHERVQSDLSRAAELRMNSEQEARMASLQEQIAVLQHGLGELPQDVSAVVGERDQRVHADISRAAELRTNNENSEQEARMASLQEQISALQRGLDNLPHEVGAVVGSHQQVLSDLPRSAEMKMNSEQEGRITDLQEQLVSVRLGLESLPQEVGAVVGKHQQVQADVPRAAELQMNLEQEARIMNLQEQIASVQHGLENLPQEVNALIGDRQQAPSDQPPAISGHVVEVLENIDEAVKRIEDQGECNVQGLTGIHAKVDAILTLHSQMAASSGLASVQPSEKEQPVVNVDLSLITSQLDELRKELKDDLPALARKLEDLITAKPPPEFVMNDAPSSAQSHDTGPSLDTTLIHTKLDELLATYQAAKEVPPSDPPQNPDTSKVCVLSFISPAAALTPE